ncbi:MAG: hypothetical protein J7M26_06300 [Armatimonadetes bacterium]|nr:hypothetical protein [Armatimonadota bacterium]
MTRQITIIVALLVLALAAQAQKAFVPESMLPRAGDQFGTPTFDTDMTLMGDPKSMEEMWAADIVSGLSLKRTVKTQREDVFGKGMEDTPLFYLLNQQETLDLSAAITERSRFTYTRKTTKQMDLLGRERAYSEYSGWGIQQGLGGGSTSLTLGFNRGIREQHSGQGSQVTRTAEQAFSLAGGLGTVGNLSLKFATSTPEEKGGTATQAIQTSLARTLSGGPAKFAFSRSLVTRGAWEQAIYKTDLSLPLAVRGGAAKFTYHRDAKVVGGNETSNRQATFAMPLAWWSKDASLTWQLTGKVKGGSETEQRTTTFVLPLRLFDRRIGNTFTDQRITAGSTITHKQAWVWQLPFEKTHLTLGYTALRPYSADGKPGPARVSRLCRSQCCGYLPTGCTPASPRRARRQSVAPPFAPLTWVPRCGRLIS